MMLLGPGRVAGPRLGLGSVAGSRPGLAAYILLRLGSQMYADQRWRVRRGARIGWRKLWLAAQRWSSISAFAAVVEAAAEAGEQLGEYGFGRCCSPTAEGLA